MEWTKKILKKISWYMRQGVSGVKLSLILLSNSILCTQLDASSALTVKETVSLKDAGKKNVVVQPGDVVTFTTAVTNSGDTAVEDAFLLTELPVVCGLVPGSLKIDGAAASSPIYISACEQNVACHGFSVAPGKTTTVSFQASINGAPPAAFTRLKKVTGVVSVKDSTEVTVVKGKPVTLTFKEPTVTPTPYAVLTASQQAVAGGESSSNLCVQPGELISVTIQAANSGDKQTRSSFMTTMPEGLRYVRNSFAVNGVQKQAFMSTEALIARDTLEIPARDQPGNPILITYQVRVAPDVEEGTQFTLSGMLSYFGNPEHEGSAASTNEIKLVVKTGK